MKFKKADSRGDHLRCQFCLLFGEGGAEGAAPGDPVGLDRSEDGETFTQEQN